MQKQKKMTFSFLYFFSAKTPEIAPEPRRGIGAAHWPVIGRSGLRGGLRDRARGVPRDEGLPAGAEMVRRDRKHEGDDGEEQNDDHFFSRADGDSKPSCFPLGPFEKNAPRSTFRDSHFSNTTFSPGRYFLCPVWSSGTVLVDRRDEPWFDSSSKKSQKKKKRFEVGPGTPRLGAFRAKTGLQVNLARIRILRRSLAHAPNAKRAEFGRALAV